MTQGHKSLLLLGLAGLLLALSVLARAASSGSASTAPELTPSQRGLTLLVSGGSSGELLPCGCIWSARGGIARRATVLAEWRAAAGEDEVVRIDLGNLQSQDPLTSEIVNAALYEDLRRDGVSLIGVGAEDAARGYESLLGMARATGARLLSANLVYHDNGEPAFEPYALVGGGGTPRLALVGLTRPDPALMIGGERNRTLVVEDPGEALARWLPRASAEAEHVIVMGDLRRHQANRLLRDYPSSLALLIPSFDYQPDGPLTGARGVLALEHQGVQVLAYRVGPGGETLARRATLHDGVPGDGAVASSLQPVLDRVNEALRAGHADREPDPLDERYTGGEACASCHREEHGIWSRGPHARAWTTLVEADREWTVACNICHVTGAGDDEAWLDPARTPQLTGVQCEACHGPGREHAHRPSAGFGAVDLERCRACHNELYSPDFFPEEAWLRIAHGAAAREPSR